jgi:hypothetical protein
MELDEKKINELLDAIMLKARDNRTQIPYSREDSFPQCVLFIGPNFEPAAQPVTWRNEDEKYHMDAGSERSSQRDAMPRHHTRD